MQDTSKNANRVTLRRGVVAAVLLTLFIHLSPAQAYADSIPITEQVEEDWRRQETRMGRTVRDTESVRLALIRAKALQGHLGDACDAAAHARLTELTAHCNALETMRPRERQALYYALRWCTRDMALSNPLIVDTPLVFMQRRRFICQMLHEYLGYYYDYGDVEGGGVYLLERPGRSLAIRDLIDGRLPRGNFTTLALSYDARTLYFSFAERAGDKPDYYSKERRCFHLYALDMETGDLRAMTDGNEDDFDPCPLPDGGIAFMSTRRGGFTRCNNPWEPLPAHTLHRLEPDGTIHRLSYHETSEWHPKVLHDGRIAYIRWDYVDRSAAHFHGIWTTNPDGTHARQLFGNYTQHINACYQPHPVPGSRRIAFLAGAHHANVGGSLVLFDPAKAALHPGSGEDDFASLESLTPHVCFPEAPDDWPDSYYHSPWPLSEDFYLVSFSFDPLPGMSARTNEDTETGIYLFDRFGNLELLFRAPGISSMYPIPLKARAVPPSIPSTCDNALGDTGEFMLTNVYDSHFPFPPGRRIVALHVYQLLPKSETHVANDPRIGYANAESARMLLGAVPVEEDGSAFFRAPAGKPLAFHAIDESGRAAQGMRSAVYLQPGERRSCVGCHESTENSGDTGRSRPMALHKPPSEIAPGPEGTRPWNFQRLVQPVLDRHCVRCHGDGEKVSPRLDNAPNGVFTEAYLALKPYVRWYEWSGESISAITTRPGEMPADVSPLAGILADGNHADDIELADEELRALYLWMDGNAAFYGAYSATERTAQFRGDTIAPPALQ